MFDHVVGYLPAVGVGGIDLHPALQQHKQRIAHLTLVDDDAVLAIAADGALERQRPQNRGQSCYQLLLVSRIPMYVHCILPPMRTLAWEPPRRRISDPRGYASARAFQCIAWDQNGGATGGSTATRLTSWRTPLERVLAHRLRTWLRIVETATSIWAAIWGAEKPWHRMPSTCSSVAVSP